MTQNRPAETAAATPITIAGALTAALRDAMTDDPERRRLRRGRRSARRRLPGDRRTGARVRRPAHLGFAARRVRHRRHRDRHGDVRDAPGRRDAVRRVQLPGVRADHLAPCQDAQPHQGPDHAADRHPHPLRGRHRRRRAPLRLIRGVLDPHAGSHRRYALEPSGRLLDAARGHRERRSRHFPRAEEPLLAEGRRCTSRSHPADDQGGGPARGNGCHAHGIRPDGEDRAAVGRARLGRGLVDRGHRPAQPLAVRRRDRRRIRAEDLACRDHPRGSPVRRIRRRGRGARHRAPVLLPRSSRSCGSPDSTSRSRRRSSRSTTCRPPSACSLRSTPGSGEPCPTSSCCPISARV